MRGREKRKEEERDGERERLIDKLIERRTEIDRQKQTDR